MKYYTASDFFVLWLGSSVITVGFFVVLDLIIY
jgi:hypothetical protein